VSSSSTSLTSVTSVWLFSTVFLCTSEPTCFPQRIVIALHCSFGLGWVLAENCPLCCSASYLASCPTCVSKFLKHASWFFWFVREVCTNFSKVSSSLLLCSYNVGCYCWYIGCLPEFPVSCFHPHGWFGGFLYPWGALFWKISLLNILPAKVCQLLYFFSCCSNCSLLWAIPIYMVSSTKIIPQHWSLIINSLWSLNCLQLLCL